MEGIAIDCIDPLVFLQDKFVVVDFETTNLEKGDSRNYDNRIVLANYIVYDHGEIRSNTIYGGEYEMGELVDEIDSAPFFVAHNTKFEYGWLKRCGLDITKKLAWCTQIGEYVIKGNTSKKGDLSLNAVADKYDLGQKDSFVSILIKGGVCPSEIPKRYLAKYCEKDVLLTLQVFLRQRDEIVEKGLLNVNLTRTIVTPVLVEIERNGMKLDEERVVRTHEEYEEKLNDITRRIEEFAGGINLSSPKQVSELLYEQLGFNELTDRRGNPLRTAKDGRKADLETIGKLKARNKRQREFLALIKERSKVNAALTKTLRFCRAVVSELDRGIFHANFNQTVTKTHRLSSTGKPVAFDFFKGKEKGIQFQNFPRSFKPLFTARNKGWLIGEVDGAQLEFRVAVFYGQDERGISDIREGTDVHQFTAQTLTEAGESTTRQDAKSRTFKPLYGGSSGTKAERAYYKAFREKYRGISSEQDKWLSIVEREKYLRLPTGFMFYWPDTKWDGRYLKNTTSICNFPVQSLATADIIPIALVSLYHRLKENNMKSFIVNTIHDSVIMEVHPDEVEKVQELAREAFTTDVYNYLQEVYGIDFNVPLGVEGKYGKYWNDEIVYQDVA